MSIEISPAPDLYLVEFVLGPQPNERISIIIPATCGLAAMARVWTLFPEYRAVAKRTSVHPVKYVEIDWRDLRIIVKKERRPFTSPSVLKVPNKRNRKKSPDEEEAE